MGDQSLPWKELFEWSMKQHTGSTDRSELRPLSEADRKWLEEALKSAMVDLAHRMQDIKAVLDESETSEKDDESRLKEKEQLLEELLEIVESIDQARDLSTIGGLQPLLNLLQSPHPSLRWRAAEVLATCAQNNPDVQQHFTDAGVLTALWPLLDDPSDVCQTKALLAVSCTVRGYSPAMDWFCNHNGVAKLCECLSRPNQRLQRKCLQLLDYTFTHVSGESEKCVTGPLPGLLKDFRQADDEDLREAAQLVQRHFGMLIKN